MVKTSRVLKKIACFGAVLVLGITNFCSNPYVGQTIVYADAVNEHKVVGLSAYYTGGAVLLGETIDTEKLKVTVLYDNGTSSEVKDYSLITSRITQVGTNECIVVYKGHVAKFYINGKTLTSFHASYYGPAVSIGNGVDPRKVSATAVYSDGSSENVEDFIIVNKVITTIGINTITIAYKNLTYNVTVLGTAPKEMISLYATYSGGPVTIGGTVNQRELEVTAVYKDGTNEIINNYSLTPEKITKQGVQLVVASYHGMSAPFQVTGAQKDIVSIKATYQGDPVGVGYSVRKSDVEVVATYNDGTKQQITEFKLNSPTITYEGFHIVTAEAGGCTSEFIVEGVSAQNISFSNALSFQIASGAHKGKVEVNLPKNVNGSLLTGSNVASNLVTRVLSRAVRKSEFLAFEIGTVDEENTTESMIDEFPLIMRVTVPNGFNVKDCELYYTPNRKTIIAKMNTEVTGKNTLQCTIFNPGTYILSYKKEK